MRARKPPVTRPLARMKAIHDEEGYREAQAAYIKAVTRLAVAQRPRG